MSTLELRSRPSEAAPRVSLLSLRGDLNLGTLVQLESHLSELKSQGRLRVVVDLDGLNFISSSGLGAFLSTVNHFRKSGGDLAFVRLSPKIQRVFSLVGFHRVLTVMDTAEQALAHFAAADAPKAKPAAALRLRSEPGAQHSGQPFQLTVEAVDEDGRPVAGLQGAVKLRPGWGIVSPVELGPLGDGRWGGPIILTGPGAVLLKAGLDALEGSQTFQILEDRAPAVFPVQLACPGCRQSLKAESSDVHRCRTCNEILLVDRWGQPISLRKGGEPAPQSAQVFQLLVPSDVNVLGGVRAFVCAMLRGHGFEERFVDDVELSVEEALCNVVEHAYQYDPTQTIALRLIVEKDAASLLLRDTGKAFDPKGLAPVDLERHLAEGNPGGLGRYLMTSLMDYIDYRSSPEGNTLLMEKKRVPTV